MEKNKVIRIELTNISILDKFAKGNPNDAIRLMYQQLEEARAIIGKEMGKPVTAGKTSPPPKPTPSSCQCRFDEKRLLAEMRPHIKEIFEEALAPYVQG